jgi:hypothetical protein
MPALESKLTLPMIVYLPDGHRQVLDFTCLYRIRDTVLILNRTIERWQEFHAGLDRSTVWSDAAHDAIRIQVIESTFTFITFFFLLIGFHKGVTQAVRDVLSELAGDVTALPPFP